MPQLEKRADRRNIWSNVVTVNVEE